MEIVKFGLAGWAAIARGVDGGGEELAEVNTEECEEQKEDNGRLDHAAPIPKKAPGDVDGAEDQAANDAEEVVIGENGSDRFACFGRGEGSEERGGNEEGEEHDGTEPCCDGGEFEELEEVAHLPSMHVKWV